MDFKQPAPPDSAPDRAQDRQLDEQVVLLFRHAPSIFFGNVAGGLGIALMLWDSAPSAQLESWLFVLSFVTCARAGLVILFHSYWRSRLPILMWGWLFVVGAALSGIAWGSLSLLSFVAAPTNLAGIGLVLAGLISASAPALGAFFPAYLAFALPAILPFSLRCAQSAESIALGMAVVSIAFLISSLIFGWHNNRSILRSIQLRFDNLDLLRRLREQSSAADLARQEAESANAAKTRFLAAASHDLRQPLQSITLLAEALAIEEDLVRSRQLATGIQDASVSMAYLMNELLDYSHIHAGGLRPELRSFELSSLLSRINTEFAPLAEAKGLHLRLRCPRLTVRSDAGMLERILRNLLANAIKYASEGGILIGARIRDDKVRIEVWDTGKGIPADMLENVFHEFYQLDNPERDSRKGLGLGLAIVASLAQLMGSKLRVNSRVGRGSVFSLELPRSQAPAVRAETTRLQEKARGSGRVLIIDNEPEILQAMGSLLYAWGFQPITAESAEQALTLLESAPDAILADFRLRDGCTGIDAITAVRDYFSTSIPAALITGDTDPHRLSEAKSCGLPLLQKPTPSAALHKLICSLLQHRLPKLDSQTNPA